MIGIDFAIKNINDLLTAKLWLGNTTMFYGRVYENEYENGIVPEISDEQRYTEVMHDRKFDAQLFWRVLPSNKRNGEPISVQLFVYVNILKLYPTEDNRDALEIAARDLINVLRLSAFRFGNLVIGKESFSFWKGSSQNKHDMQPWAMFRIDGSIPLDMVSVGTPITSIDLTILAGSHGTSSPVPWVYFHPYSKNNPVIIPINAIPDAGYQFDYWLIDGAINTSALTYVRMYASISAQPFFKLI
jgi:hypothetical protein